MNSAHISPTDLGSALKDSGVRFDDWCDPEILLTKIAVVPAETQVDLVSVSARELGFAEAPVLEDLYRRAKELGLRLVPAETGPRLLLSQHIMRQGESESFLMAMEPVMSLDGYLQVFEISWNKDGQWIGTGDFRPSYLIGIDIRWVFAHREQSVCC